MSSLGRLLIPVLTFAVLCGCSNSPTEQQPDLTLADFPGWYEFTAEFRDPGDGPPSWKSWISFEDSTWIVSDGVGPGGTEIRLCWAINCRVEASGEEG